MSTSAVNLWRASYLALNLTRIPSSASTWYPTTSWQQRSPYVSPAHRIPKPSTLSQYCNTYQLTLRQSSSSFRTPAEATSVPDSAPRSGAGEVKSGHRIAFALWYQICVGMAPRRPHQAPRPLHPGPTATSSCVSAEPHHNTADSALRMNISTWISGLSAHKMDRRHFVAHKMDPLAMSRGHEPRFARGADAASSLRAASGVVCVSIGYSK